MAPEVLGRVGGTRGNLQDRATTAIVAAFFDELAAVGYGQLSVDAIAKRAGVGKASIYRRWPSKQEMAVSLIAGQAVHVVAVPDTGDFEGDVARFLIDMAAVLGDATVRRVLPDVLAEAGRNDGLRAALRDSVQVPRRATMAALFERAVARGELAADCDVDRGLDMLIGPLYWRTVVMREDLQRPELVALGRMIVTAVRQSGSS